MSSSSPHPQWATKFRAPGTELRCIRGKYYLYAVSSKYDPVKKRPKKITGPLLGSISESGGFKKSAKKSLSEKAASSVDPARISVREFGFASFLIHHNSLIYHNLSLFFPELVNTIIYLAYSRLVYNSPLRDIPLHISKSFLSLNDNFHYTEKFFAQALRDIGKMRNEAALYMKRFFPSSDFVLVDMTNIFSASDNIRFSKTGYNSDMIFDKQFNLMYLYSPSLMQPVFFRLFSGNIKEVRGFKLCLQESGLQNAVIIADKGFYSESNIALLLQEELNFIIPLKRNNSFIDYKKLERTNLAYFKFNERYIWVNSYQVGDQTLFLFKDEQLRVQEEKDYLDRVDKLPEEYSIGNFHQKAERFGTIALLTNIKEAQSDFIYTTYKSRNEVEVMFDGMKNVLNADRTYMQNEDALQGWMFVNHITLQWYYIIYSLLKEKDLLKKYSVRQFIKHLIEIKKVRINDSWFTEPITDLSAKMLKKLSIPIT